MPRSLSSPTPRDPHPEPAQPLSTLLRGITGNAALKTHLSIDPDSELIDETAVTAANVADHDAVDDLLAPVVQMAEKPDVYGDSAYADGENLSHLEDQGFTVMARVPAAHGRDGRYSKDE